MSKNAIEVQTNLKDQVCIKIPEMPWWSGPKKEKTSPKLVPFCLQSRVGEPISQFLKKSEKKEVVNIYNEQTYEFITAPPGQSDWANRLALENVSKFEGVVQINESTKVLEIGAGSTWLAEFLRNKYSCTDYTCVDPALKDHHSEYPRIITDYFPAKKITGEYFDLILAFNVLEHVDQTTSFLRAIRSALKDQGLAVICVPDCTKQFLNGDINSLIHEHLVYFTKTSIDNTLKKCGLKPIKSISENDLFTIIVKKAESSNTNCKNLDEAKYLLALGSSLTTLFGDFATELKAILSSGKRVGFHGATQGLNTFLHVGGFAGFNFHIFDGDTRKNGLFLPSVNRKIESISTDEYKKVDLMIISALSFETEIRDFIMQQTSLPEEQTVTLCAKSTRLLSEI